MARLSTLSEGGTSNFESRTSHGASESKIPQGISLQKHDPDRPPPKDGEGKNGGGVPLFDWYVWHFSHADPDDHARLLQLYLLGERDYHARVLHIPRRVALRSGEHTDADEKGMSGAIAERKAAERVVEWYEGLSAEEVAVHEYTTVAWVHKARKMHGRNTDDGRPRPPFLDWKDDERRRQIELLLAQAKHRGEILGAKAIAKHFGVDKNTVKRYLEPQAVAA